MSARTDRRAADVAEDVEWILETDPRALTEHIASRMGYGHKTGVSNALKKAGRTDLLARLARNAELAGHHVTKRAS